MELVRYSLLGGVRSALALGVRRSRMVGAPMVMVQSRHARLGVKVYLSCAFLRESPVRPEASDVENRRES